MGKRLALISALAGTLTACASSPPAGSPGASAAASTQAATTCVWRMTTSGVSTFLLSDNGSCIATVSFVHHHLSYQPGMYVTAAPSHGSVTMTAGPNLTVQVKYQPDAGFVGTDHMTVSMIYAHVLYAVYPFLIVVTGADGIFKQDPPPHSLPRGFSVLVDDGSCPAGQIKRVTGGMPRKIACISRPA